MNYITNLKPMINNKTISYVAYYFGPTSDLICKELNISIGFKMQGKNGQDVWRVSANQWKKIRKKDSRQQTQSKEK